MTLLLLLLATGDTAVSLTADAAAVRLSGVVRLTLTVEGPAPLRAEPTGLDAESAANWKLTADGEPTAGPGRWEQRYVADPFAPGEAVRLGVGPVAVWVGGAAEPQRLIPATLSVRVTTGVAEVSPSAARPPTGVERLPDPPATPPRDWTWPATGAGLVVITLVIVWGLRYRRPAAASTGDPLAGLDGLSDIEFAHRLSDAVRDRLHTDAVPARRLTTPELPAGAARDLLVRLDAVRFGGRPLTAADRAVMLDAARSVTGAADVRP